MTQDCRFRVLLSGVSAVIDQEECKLAMCWGMLFRATQIMGPVISFIVRRLRQHRRIMTMRRAPFTARAPFNARLARCLLIIGLLGGCDSAPTDADEKRASEALTGKVEQLAGRLDSVEERLAALEVRHGTLSPAGATAEAEVTVSPVPAGAGQVGETIRFSAYPEGRVFPKYGMPNMIVETSAGRALTSASGAPATFEFADFEISERIDVLVQIRTGYWTDQQLVLLDGDTEIIAITMSNYDLRFGDHVKKRSRTGWKRGEQKNELRLTIAENRARLFVNDRFFGVQEVAFSRANKVRITGIKRDKDFVYAVSVRPLS